MWRKEGVQS